MPLENGNFGICFASGLAATDGIIKLFSQGDEIISTNDLYGGTYRAFTKVYSIDSNPDLSEIVKGEVDFYAHCVTKWGLQYGFWEKVGNSAEVGELNHILFRGSKDYGHKLGDEPVKISFNWYIWKINDEYFTDVGRIEGENRKAEIGCVIAPANIVYRMQYGKYDIGYPEYE